MSQSSFRRKVARAVPLTALTFASLGSSGCTREFFRQWANQDVTEAVFEKSRDPRYRLDMFSIEPPAMSRFADPFDPDHPAAPPDDVAAEALSPVPQVPRTRLLSPVEGTGYLDMLDNWTRDQAVAGGPLTGPRPLRSPEESIRRPTPAVPNDPGSPEEFEEERKAFQGIQRNTPDDSAPMPDRGTVTPPPAPAPDQTRAYPGSNTPKTPRFTMAANDLRKTSENRGPTGGDSTPKLLNPHSASGTAEDTQSGQRVSEVAGTGEDSFSSRLANRGNPAGFDPKRAPHSGQLKPGKPVNLDTVSPERRAVVSQYMASVKTGIPLPADTPVPLRPKADAGLTRTNYQEPAQPAPATGNSTKPEAADRLPEPLEAAPGADDSDNRLGGTDTSTQLLEILNPQVKDLDAELAAGLPSGSAAYVVTPNEALTLALINSRDYQNRLENIYLTALPVTLQRFNFEPQGFAGLSPTTLPRAGGSPANFPNSFLYRTLEAPGGQSSVISQGQVAGVGKVFMSGMNVVTAFASQTVINLTGATPLQPQVQSIIPITIVQPFLKGGGRAVTLEGLTQAERNLLYEVRAYARYRQDFVTRLLLGNSAGGAANLGGFGTTAVGGGDPTIGYLPLLQSLMQIENNRNQVSNFETILTLQEEQVGGEGSGLTQLQVDQTNSQLQNARVQLLLSQVNYRNQLDQFKMQMGLPPDTPIVPDLEMIRPYRQFLRDLRAWSIRGDRELAELDVIVGRLPDLDELDVRIDDRSVLDVITGEKFDEEEELLQAAARVALENRVDLMNARAQLYDAWRQIRVSANALKGVFNVNVTNQVYTSPLDTNPFGFLSSAKQFALQFNAELPLIRLAERNTFRTTLINYQRQRRALMQSEDQLKQSIRANVRQLQLVYQQFEIGKNQLTLQIRQRDNAQEQLFAPPGSGGQATDVAVNVLNLNSSTTGLNNAANSLVTQYVSFIGTRLQLFRDLGIMPYDEWEAYYELFAPKSIYSIRVDGSGETPFEPAAAGEPLQ
ncbi:hypothetical protein GC170_13310 [bacterium]|nr:hypothetical protein [bacterium]